MKNTEEDIDKTDVDKENTSIDIEKTNVDIEDASVNRGDTNARGEDKDEFSIFAHCIKSIQAAWELGEHDIPLMKNGDWNDGMNKIGNGGKGESVWLGFFLYNILTRFIEILEYAEKNAQIKNISKDMSIGIENKKKSIKERIRELSMADVMMLFASKDKDRMTAREVIAILNEQTNLLGGIYLNAKDALTRIFERCFAIGLRKGFFQEPPEVMQRSGIKVEFLNQMARAQKAAELGSLQDLFTYATPLFQIKPDAIDNLDGDKAFDMIVKSLAIDTTIQKNPVLVQQLRDERAQQQQQMAQAQEMEQMAKTAKQAAGATIEPNNLLGAIAGGGQQAPLPEVAEANPSGMM